MKKKIAVFSICLLTLVVVAGTASAGRMALVNTEWVGDLTIVGLADGSVTTKQVAVNLTFTDEQEDYLAGNIVETTNPPPVDPPPLKLEFTGIRYGASLYLTAKDYLLFGEILPAHPVKKGVRPPRSIAIQGRCVADGTMFEGKLPLAVD